MKRIYGVVAWLALVLCLAGCKQEADDGGGYVPKAATLELEESTDGVLLKCDIPEGVWVIYVLRNLSPGGEPESYMRYEASNYWLVGKTFPAGTLTITDKFVDADKEYAYRVSFWSEESDIGYESPVKKITLSSQAATGRDFTNISFSAYALAWDTAAQPYFTWTSSPNYTWEFGKTQKIPGDDISLNVRYALPGKGTDGYYAPGDSQEAVYPEPSYNTVKVARDSAGKTYNYSDTYLDMNFALSETNGGIDVKAGYYFDLPVQKGNVPDSITMPTAEDYLKTFAGDWVLSPSETATVVTVSGTSYTVEPPSDDMKLKGGTIALPANSYSTGDMVFEDSSGTSFAVTSQGDRLELQGTGNEYLTLVRSGSTSN